MQQGRKLEVKRKIVCVVSGEQITVKFSVWYGSRGSCYGVGVDVSFQFVHSFKASQRQQFSASWESVLSCSSVSQKERGFQGRRSTLLCPVRVTSLLCSALTRSPDSAAPLVLDI